MMKYRQYANIISANFEFYSDELNFLTKIQPIKKSSLLRIFFRFSIKKL